MFWSLTGLSTVSPIETILDKEAPTLDELLDEDEIIQECKALNSRLINFLRERAKVEQLLRYVVEEAPKDAEKRRKFMFPFIACEIFTCEVDIILKALVEDELLMNFLFSFLEPDHSHSAILAGYFSKVVICLLLRKTVLFLKYIQARTDIVRKMVDLIGITSIMEVLICLIGADEHLYGNYTDTMQWLENADVLEIIMDKFSSSDCPEVHANAAETLCAVTRHALPILSAKISSPSFVGRLFRHALEESRPKSVLVNSLSVCISLLDPKRLLPSGTYQMFSCQYNQGSKIGADPQIVEGMLGSIGDLLKLLDFSSEEKVLLTTYGKLQPPLGKHRLKIVEFISVLVSVSSETAQQELIRLGAVKRILDLFFEYPYHNFLHHHVEQILLSYFESNNPSLIRLLLNDCDLIGKILNAEKNSTLDSDAKTPTVPAEGKSPPRIGNIGHLTRICNKLVHAGNNNTDVHAYLQQENSEWEDWHTNILAKRNTLENVHQWVCGRPTSLHDRRYSNDDGYQDKDYDVAALANNLSQAFQCGIDGNNAKEEGHGSLVRDVEDVYFDDESAEVVISSCLLGDDQECGSLFTNSNWFPFEDDRNVHKRSTDSIAPTSPNTMGTDIVNSVVGDDVIVKDEDVVNATSQVPAPKFESEDVMSDEVLKDSTDVGPSVLSNGELQLKEVPVDKVDLHVPDLFPSPSPSPSTSPIGTSLDETKSDAKEAPESIKKPSRVSESGDENAGIDTSTATDVNKHDVAEPEKDVYFDDESAEVVTSSHRLGDDQEGSSLFTNSNWFAFEEDRNVHKCSTNSTASVNNVVGDDVIVKKDEDVVDTATLQVPDPKFQSEDATSDEVLKDLTEAGTSEDNKPPDLSSSDAGPSLLPNSELQLEEVPVDKVDSHVPDLFSSPSPSTSPIDTFLDETKSDAKEAPELTKKTSGVSESGDGNAGIDTSCAIDVNKHDVVEQEKDIYFDDESAEVVTSSRRLGDDQEGGSLFTNSNWFAFEDDRNVHKRPTNPIASASPNAVGDDVIVKKDEDVVDTLTSQVPDPKFESEDATSDEILKDSTDAGTSEGNKPPNLSSSDAGPSVQPNGELQLEEVPVDKVDLHVPDPSPSPIDTSFNETKEAPELTKKASGVSKSGDENAGIDTSAATDVIKHDVAKPERIESGN